MAREDSHLAEISPDAILPNPDNPRLIFREEDMRDLLESIHEVGIKVPLALYRDGEKYRLLDGERRWRCAKKLNLKTVPAIVQPKPSRLQNLLMMFNIHNVRVDWDLMPTALKLVEVRDLLEKGGKRTSPNALASVTGLSVTTVRRALELIELPRRYQDMLLEEAEKPRKEQRVKADLFIEIYKSLHAIERHTPEVFKQIGKAEYVSSMVDKYLTGVIDNVVHFREVSKIARSELAQVSKREAVPVILKLVKDKNYRIQQAFEDTVQAAYEQRDLETKVLRMIEKLSMYKSAHELSQTVCEKLVALRNEIDNLFRK
jgi:ParB/RepB/Spo0J family partition protein